MCAHSSARAHARERLPYLPSFSGNRVYVTSYLKKSVGLGASVLIQFLTASCCCMLLLSNSGGMCACVLVMFCHMSLTASVTHLYLGLPTLRLEGVQGTSLLSRSVPNVMCRTGCFASNLFNLISLLILLFK